MRRARTRCPSTSASTPTPTSLALSRHDSDGTAESTTTRLPGSNHLTIAQIKRELATQAKVSLGRVHLFQTVRRELARSRGVKDGTQLELTDPRRAVGMLGVKLDGVDALHMRISDAEVTAEAAGTTTVSMLDEAQAQVGEEFRDGEVDAASALLHEAQSGYTRHVESQPRRALAAELLRAQMLQHAVRSVVRTISTASAAAVDASVRTLPAASKAAAPTSAAPAAATPAAATPAAAVPVAATPAAAAPAAATLLGAVPDYATWNGSQASYAAMLMRGNQWQRRPWRRRPHRAPATVPSSKSIRGGVYYASGEPAWGLHALWGLGYGGGLPTKPWSAAAALRAIRVDSRGEPVESSDDDEPVDLVDDGEPVESSDDDELEAAPQTSEAATQTEPQAAQERGNQEAKKVFPGRGRRCSDRPVDSEPEDESTEAQAPKRARNTKHCVGRMLD